MLEPTSFSPVLALIGVGLTMMAKSERKKDVGMIRLGFAVLMFGMDTMSGAVAGLQDVPEFQSIFLMFTKPVLGVLAGAILTATHPEFLRLGGYSAGSVGHRPGDLWRGHPHHHGAEHRHLPSRP